MAETPETPVKHERSDEEYVRLGRREIVIGLVLLVAAAVGYWQYGKTKSAVMDNGAAELTHSLAPDEEYSYITGPEGTEAEVLETIESKGGGKQLRIRVGLIQGATLAPGNYTVIVGTKDGKETKSSFTVKVEQKK